MSIFKADVEAKRVIFNVNSEIFKRLEAVKAEARSYGKRLDVDTTINKSLDKFLKKAEKRLAEMRRDGRGKSAGLPKGDDESGPEGGPEGGGNCDGLDV
jgi:hypothetical protein